MKKIHINFQHRYYFRTTMYGWFDGGARLKSQRSASGSILFASNKQQLQYLDMCGTFLSSGVTNNVAEYTALLTLFQLAVKNNANRIAIRGDSDMIVFTSTK